MKRAIFLFLILFVCMGNSCPKKGIQHTPLVPIKPISVQELGGVRSNIVVKTNIQVIASNGKTVTIPLVSTSQSQSHNLKASTKRPEQLFVVTPEEKKPEPKAEPVAAPKIESVPTSIPVTVEPAPQTLPEKPKEKTWWERNCKLVYYYGIVGVIGWLIYRYSKPLKAFLRRRISSAK